MPIIAKFYGIVIRLICAPGLGPRFSAIYGDSEIIVDIASLRVICGNIPARAKDMILEWASTHHQELLDVRNRFRIVRQRATIQPLD